MRSALAGQEGFELEVGPWSVLGNRSLTHGDYQPDFDAVALPPFRLLRIRRADYNAAVQATTLDPHIGRQQVTPLLHNILDFFRIT